MVHVSLLLFSRNVHVHSLLRLGQSPRKICVGVDLSAPCMVHETHPNLRSWIWCFEESSSSELFKSLQNHSGEIAELFKPSILWFCCSRSRFRVSHIWLGIHTCVLDWGMNWAELVLDRNVALQCWISRTPFMKVWISWVRMFCAQLLFDTSCRDVWFSSHLKNDNLSVTLSGHTQVSVYDTSLLSYRNTNQHVAAPSRGCAHEQKCSAAAGQHIVRYSMVRSSKDLFCLLWISRTSVLGDTNSFLHQNNQSQFPSMVCHQKTDWARCATHPLNTVVVFLPWRKD